MRRLWPLNLLLLAGVVFFAWKTRTFMNREQAPPRPASVGVEAPADPAVGSAPSPLPPPREQYQVVVERNLFSATRSPAPPPPAPVVETKPAVPVENPQDRYVLYGVVRLGGGKSFAILKDKKAPNAKPRAYGIGDVLGGGHAVRLIEEARVVVATAGRDSELKLRAPKGPEDTGFVPRPVTSPTPTPAAQPVQPPTPMPDGMRAGSQVQRPGQRQPLPVQQPQVRKAPVPRPPVVYDEEDEDEMLDDFDEEEFEDEDLYDEDEEE